MEGEFSDVTDALPSPLYALFSARNIISEINVNISISQKRKLRYLAGISQRHNSKSKRSGV